MKNSIKGFLLAAGTVMASTPAMAQDPSCALRADFVEQLDEKYGETIVVLGLAENLVLEVYANTKTGSWTVATTNAEGIMCIRLVGTDFTPLPSVYEFLGELG